MGHLFRSEPMVLCQLFIPPEAAYFTVTELGEKGIVQFIDSSEDVNAFQRRFVNEVRRCSEMERRLRFLEAAVKRDNLLIPEMLELPKALKPREVADLEAHLEKSEGDIREMSESTINLKHNALKLVQLIRLLEKTQGFFNEDDIVNSFSSAHQQLIYEDIENVEEFSGFIVGVIRRERIPAFERMLWRISKGTIFFRLIEIDESLEDPVTGIRIYKSVFVIFFPGESFEIKIKKVCEGFHATVYNCPNSLQERIEMLQQVRTRLADLNLVLNETQDHCRTVLTNIAKDLQKWKVMISKMKAVYHTLNYFNMDVTKKCFIGECWVPNKNIPTLQKALDDASTACDVSVPSFLNILSTKQVPPTFNETNKFTNGFQNLINTYGVSSYGESNPALYTIITFPFLFAVMFGDAGHAIILTSFGLYMVLAEKKLNANKKSSEIFDIFFAGRYIILLMGIFSIYTGVVYNDIFSKSINLFGSRWFIQLNKTEALKYEERYLNPSYDYKGPPYYWFGLDPAWQLAKNKIIFLNSYKMKLSIIFGVVHMSFGVCISVINFIHFRKYSSIFLEFLPQILLLCLLFLWMVVMIFMKWVMYSAHEGQLEFGSSCAPSILVYFIDMILLFKKPDPPENCTRPYMFNCQSKLQRGLVYGSLGCILVLLLGKPSYIKYRKIRRRQIGVHLEVTQESTSVSHHEEEDEAEEESITEIFIHQAIHTIEFVLSTVSHTASYLRLWALSLAHAQLSEVLWIMVLRMGLVVDSYIGAVKTFVCFAIWAFFTVTVLVAMEGLSAFLHTLRLHWVEFMSKFYEGLGYSFQPFSFGALLNEAGLIEE